MTILETENSGLIGSDAVEHFDRQGHHVSAVDKNNMRREFLGVEGDTLWHLTHFEKVASASRFVISASPIARDLLAILGTFTSAPFCTAPSRLLATLPEKFRSRIAKSTFLARPSFSTPSPNRRDAQRRRRHECD